MKWTETGDRRIKSEGKLIEVMPIIEDPYGQPFMLPPAVWEVENWLVGYKDEHTVGMPITFYHPEKLQIPGSNGSAPCRLSFMTRMMERSPDSMPGSRTIDLPAAMMIAQTIRDRNTQ